MGYCTYLDIIAQVKINNVIYRTNDLVKILYGDYRGGDLNE